MTQEILKQNECRTLIFYARDFLARHSPSLDEGKDLPMQEEPFALKLPDWLQTNDLRIFSLKTYPEMCIRDRIEEGYDADLCILDQELQLVEVIAKGNTVYTK